MAGASEPSIAVIFLGNPLMGDDSVGLRIGWLLEPRLRKLGAEVVVTTESGLSLLDYMYGKDTVVLVDAVPSSNALRPGEVTVSSVEGEHSGAPLAPHYIGIPELRRIMEELGLGSPRRIFLIGIGVEDPYTIREELSPQLEERLAEIADKVYGIIAGLLGISPET